MSRVGRKPIPIPEGVEIRLDGSRVSVRGPKGELARSFDPEMKIEVADGTVRVSRPSDQPRHRAIHGLTRSLLANMVIGVTEGFEKVLEIHGVGYRAQKRGNGLVLSVGFSHTVEIQPAEGIELELERPTLIRVRGIDKQLVGQTAAEIRQVRPPEPYKGKGIRYEGEHVRRKAGKATVGGLG
ncbi:MAG: 50S ribosomal protein L6 [Gemmatimonadota bacterium]